jgi:hypothetical protein
MIERTASPSRPFLSSFSSASTPPIFTNARLNLQQQHAKASTGAQSSHRCIQHAADATAHCQKLIQRQALSSRLLHCLRQTVESLLVTNTRRGAPWACCCPLCHLLHCSQAAHAQVERSLLQLHGRHGSV